MINHQGQNQSSQGQNQGPKKTGIKIMSISRTILSILWEIGSGTVEAFFPHPYSHAFCSHRTKQNFYVSLAQLKKRGLIKKNSSDTFSLTPEGKREAFWAHLDAKLSLRDQKRQRWDGLWRMIFFDIPEKKRRLRDDLRGILKILGFKELQRSVWVTPHKIPDILSELLWEEKIKHHTRFITVKEIDYDKDLRRVFKL